MVRVGGVARSARIVAVQSWSWILAETPDGRQWLETVFNISAASFTRLALLHPGIAADAVDGVAEALAWHPRRTDATDVPQVERLGAPGDAIDWTPPD